ncbi:DUF2993 domain-containing protein [Alkalinema sp. FACHB-956]|uniref:LmeA family phospholipid-binding protein n=1 Tax=Alkalinema sp. FACHB-956 TaxID=2692768 RepID=UPI001683D31B|nr:DUF2993 domain-containing protein [Alkalinema sp. FACHB-956]MBD2329778.1 DUF2993 domain-containing protein [Alkalinema sp. FACHB-956]
MATDGEGKATGLISKVLGPAIRFWLRSQMEQIEQLELQILAGDRQILSGQIPQVLLSAQSAVYQGIHLSQVNLVGQAIQVNVGQVMRGKALQLLAPVPIDVVVCLTEADLNASLNAPLLAPAIEDFLKILFASGIAEVDSASPDIKIDNLQAKLAESWLTVRADLLGTSQVTPIALRTGLTLSTPNQLQLTQPHWLPHPTAKRGLPLSDFEGYCFDLGDGTTIEQLSILDDRIHLQGRLQVSP